MNTAGQLPSVSNAPASDQPISEHAPAEASRRTFTAMLATAFAAFIATAVGVPGVAYIASPLARRNTAGWTSLGSVASFSSGEPKQVAVSVTNQDGWRQLSTSRTVWVTPSATGELVVFNGRCTHLGCAYSWQAGGAHANTFFCPCHEGVYDSTGAVQAGPPPRPLDRLETIVVDGELFVLYQDFRLGVPTQEQV